MKKIFNTFIAAVLAITFVTCIYCYGENKRFSLRKYIENVSAGFAEMHTIEDIANIWKDDEVAGSVENGEIEEEKSFWKRASDFFKSIGDFFVKLWQSIKMIALIIADVFKNLYTLLPWTGENTEVY